MSCCAPLAHRLCPKRHAEGWALQVVTCDSPAGRLGLSTCYDLRFPHLYQRLVLDGGARLLLVPSAFTRPTGPPRPPPPPPPPPIDLRRCTCAPACCVWSLPTPGPQPLTPNPWTFKLLDIDNSEIRDQAVPPRSSLPSSRFSRHDHRCETGRGGLCDARWGACRPFLTMALRLRSLEPGLATQTGRKHVLPAWGHGDVQEISPRRPSPCSHSACLLPLPRQPVTCACLSVRAARTTDTCPRRLDAVAHGRGSHLAVNAPLMQPRCPSEL